MTDREPTRGLRFDAWHLLRFVAAAAVAIALFVASFSHVTYEVYGDPSVYFSQLDLLRHGGVRTIGPAPDGEEDASAAGLRTEGGFAALLWLCRSIHLRTVPRSSSSVILMAMAGELPACRPLLRLAGAIFSLGEAPWKTTAEPQAVRCRPPCRR